MWPWSSKVNNVNEKHDAATKLQCQVRRIVHRRKAEEEKMMLILRYHQINELLSFEEEYVQVLNSLMEHFITPLEWNAKTTKDAILPKKDIESCFGAFVELRVFDTQVLNVLKSSLQDRSRTTHVLVGQGLFDTIPSLCAYTAYANGYLQCLCHLKWCLATRPLFREWMKGVESVTASNLTHTLALPKQRLPQLNNLVREVLLHTKQESPDLTPLTIFADTLDTVVKCLREQHSMETDPRSPAALDHTKELMIGAKSNREILYGLKLRGVGPDFVCLQRRLVLEDDVELFEPSGIRCQLKALLFTDLLLLASGSPTEAELNVQHKIFLKDAQTKTLPNSTFIQDAIGIVGQTTTQQPQPQAQAQQFEYVVLCMGDATKRNIWLDALDHLVAKATYNNSMGDPISRLSPTSSEISVALSLSLSVNNLAKCRVKIEDSVLISQRHAFVLYVVSFVTDSGSSFRFHKRFSEFAQLHKELCKTNAKLPKLPERHLDRKANIQQQVRSERLFQLDFLLQHALLSPSLQHSPALHAFLNLSFSPPSLHPQQQQQGRNPSNSLPSPAFPSSPFPEPPTTYPWPLPPQPHQPQHSPHQQTLALKHQPSAQSQSHHHLSLSPPSSPPTSPRPGGGGGMIGGMIGGVGGMNVVVLGDAGKHQMHIRGDILGNELCGILGHKRVLNLAPLLPIRMHVFSKAGVQCIGERDIVCKLLNWHETNTLICDQPPVLSSISAPPRTPALASKLTLPTQGSVVVLPRDQSSDHNARAVQKFLDHDRENSNDDPIAMRAKRSAAVTIPATIPFAERLVLVEYAIEWLLRAMSYLERESHDVNDPISVAYATEIQNLLRVEAWAQALEEAGRFEDLQCAVVKRLSDMAHKQQQRFLMSEAPPIELPLTEKHKSWVRQDDPDTCAQPPTVFAESVDPLAYIHFLRLIAVAINDDFQTAVQNVFYTKQQQQQQPQQHQQKQPYVVIRAPIKPFSHMWRNFVWLDCGVEDSSAVAEATAIAERARTDVGVMQSQWNVTTFGMRTLDVRSSRWSIAQALEQPEPKPRRKSSVSPSTPHHGLRTPTPALNLDMCRATVVVDSLENVENAVKLLERSFVVRGYVNGFDADFPVLEAPNFGCRCVTLSIVFSPNMTHKELSENPTVKAKWKTYQTLHKHASQVEHIKTALQWLTENNTVLSQRVRLVCEIRIFTTQTSNFWKRTKFHRRFARARNWRSLWDDCT